MRTFLAILFFLPLFVFGQYRADRTGTNPDLTGKDASGYGIRARMGVASSVVDYCAEADSLFVRMAEVGYTPTTQRKATINTAIESLKTAGIWARLDILYFFACANESAAVLNWVRRDFTGVPAGSPTFESDTGFTGGNTKSINTTYNGSTDAVNMSLASASMGVYSFDNVSEDATDAGIQVGYDNAFLIISRWSGDVFYGDVHYGLAMASQANTSSIGFFSTSRTGSLPIVTTQYKNGSPIGTPYTTNTTGAIANGDIYVLARGNGTTHESFSSKTIGMFYISASLTSTQMAAFYTIINNYLSTINP